VREIAAFTDSCRREESVSVRTRYLSQGSEACRYERGAAGGKEGPASESRES
jgi:hypothetical protein